MILALLATRKSKIDALIDIFLSLISRLNVLFVHPNGYDYPMFYMRTDDGDMFWKSQVLGG
jgi:hypothetical protein